MIGVCYDITERRREQEKQMLLAREVDHRARNVLAVVQSILRLTRAEDPRRYVEAVEGRVAALARAHTLLSRDSWTGASLQDVVQEELTAYRGAGRAWLTGPPIRLAAEAVQPLSMVLHELATNAAKYGALSLPGGRVDVSWKVEAEHLHLLWREHDGPPVLVPPQRRGFGSTMIAATLHDQLHGTVRFDWHQAGLGCAITLPAASVISGGVAQDLIAAAPSNPTPAASLLGCRVLLVEDEPLVRLLMEATLARLGCVVIGPAATLEEAQRLAGDAGERPDAAVLDVNLQGRVSFPVAETLARRGIPVIFLTGYGELDEAPAGRNRVLRKPLDEAALADALRAVLAPLSAPAA
jgi:two-component sensor histidine kinase